MGAEKTIAEVKCQAPPRVVTVGVEIVGRGWPPEEVRKTMQR
jgi:hypothetical protein